MPAPTLSVPHRCLWLFAPLALLAGPLCARNIVWTRLEAEKFTIISAVPEDETLSWAVEFEQFHRGIEKVMRFNEAGLQPVTVVLFESQRDMRPYKLLEKGQPAEVDGMFFRTPIGNFIEVSADHEDEQTRRLVFHEGVHWLTNVSETQPPLWLDEGLAEVFSTFSVDRDLYDYGKVLPEHVVLLNQLPMMPLKQLLAVQHGSLLYNEGERTSIFYAESWAFVHYLLFSGKLEERAKYNELVRALRPGSDPDAVFRKVFGVDCAAMDIRLKRYLRDGDYTINRIKFDRSEVEKSFKVRRASPVEVDLAQSSLLSAANRLDEAIPRLERITREIPDNPAPWEAEGFAAYETADYELTETCFRHAAGLGSHNYFVYSFLGDVELGVHPGSFGPGAINNLRAAADFYEKELGLNPRDQHAYDNLAGNAYSLDPITDADAATLRAGARLFPGDSMAQAGLAVLDLRQGGEAGVASGTAALQAIAADPSHSNQFARDYAQNVLDDRERSETTERINDMFQKQDFDGVVAYTEELLRKPRSPGDRDNLQNAHDHAAVAAMMKHGLELAGSGNLADAKRVLLEADSKATDLRVKAQIETILDRIAKAGTRREQ